MDPRDRLVVALLRDPKGALAALQRDTVSLVARADLHGVGGVLQDALHDETAFSAILLLAIAFGKIATKALNLLGTKVAEVAEVTLDLRATPQP